MGVSPVLVGIYHFWRGKHPHINKQGSINPGSTLFCWVRHLPTNPFLQQTGKPGEKNKKNWIPTNRQAGIAEVDAETVTKDTALMLAAWQGHVP